LRLFKGGKARGAKATAHSAERKKAER